MPLLFLAFALYAYNDYKKAKTIESKTENTKDALRFGLDIIEAFL